MIKNVFVTGAITLFLLGSIDACKDMGSDVPPAAPSPTVTSITPDSAEVGDTVTVNGTNFGSSQGSSTIHFTPGIAAAVIISWTSTSIIVKVPDGATTGVVSVSVGGIASNGFQFKTSVAVDTLISFSAKVLPIFLNNCAVSGCHSGSSPLAGFNPSTYQGLRAGGFTFGTSVVIAFDSTNSGVMQMIRSSANPYGLRMPQGGQYFATGLPDSLIVTIGTWIQQGALNN